MDARGNIGIGYSFGGTPNYAGQRFAARLADDPPGRLTLGETVLVEGEAAQPAMRWEDYTQTAMDPVDDCTIWHVGDYLQKDATAFPTKIGAFRCRVSGGGRSSAWRARPPPAGLNSRRRTSCAALTAPTVRTTTSSRTTWTSALTR
jgi:hypothetical protein